MFGAGITSPQQMEGLSDVDVAHVAISRTQHYAVTSDGKVLTWKAPRARPGMPIDLSIVVPRILPGLTDVAIKQVACGISFLVLLTERNILMTSGNGSQGCLGHGDYEDGDQPRIVEALLAVEVESISAGSAHVRRAFSNRNVHPWMAWFPRLFA
jgi:NIMA (never in mitosis gene a)-related kinase